MAASTSSGNVNIEEKYDVFISFRGEDTRDGFTSHLHAALERKNIKAFIDYELKKGGEISGNLEKAVEESKVSLVVFSEDYASSRWCLNELVKIMDCMKSNRQQMVIPIFYQIKPSEVRHQSGSFAGAFSKHQCREKKDKVQSWKAALTEASALSGWDSSVIKPESVLVNMIVKDVLEKLNYDSLPYMEGTLVGIDSRIDQIKTLLNIDECSDVFSVGIWGMAGIGKTTMAEVVYNQISTQFEGCFFLENVKERSRESNGLYALKEKLLSRLLDENIYLETLRTQSTYIKSRLRRRRVLIVLDDVTDSSQFEILVGALDAFGPGSRIIVTSRDRQVLINCGVFEDKIYQVLELEHLDALELFYRHAFKGNHPPHDLLKLSYLVVMFYAQRIPLALRVLGSSLQNKSRRYWKDTLKKLKQVSNPKIDDVLRTSFDGLDDEQKSIFLDIACFFNGDDMDDTVEILASCYRSIYAGMEDLIDKSLITLSDNRLEMHDLLREMGRQVVRSASKLPNSSNSEPGKQSRLWNSKDVFNVLTKNSGTEHIEGIFLDTSNVEKIQLSHTVFSRMPNLRLLKVFSSAGEKEPKLHLPEQVLESLPSELRYLYWDRYPLRSLPSNFNPKKLVEFSMPHSNLEELWVEPMVLVKLKKINLRYSKISGSINILSGARWLRELDLSGNPIQEIPASIGFLNKLVRLLLNDCKLLNNLPSSVRKLDTLEYLSLARCTSFSEFPELPENIRELLLKETAIVEVPSSVGHLSKLKLLDLQKCKSLKSLSSSICKMKSARWLHFEFCSKLENFPEILEKMESLEELNLEGTALKCLPSSIGNLTNLRTLFLQGTAIQELPSSLENVVKLRMLSLKGARNLTKIPNTLQLIALDWVEFSNCPALTKFVDNSEAIGFLSSVSNLILTGNNFERLPNLGQFPMLKGIDIRDCKRLKSLPELPPHVQVLDAHGCTSLESIGNFHLLWNQDYSYRFSNCFNLIQASSEIIANAHRNIQLMAAEDVERFNHQVLLKGFSSAYFSLPTTEIPPWFNAYQSIGSSIVVQVQQLPPCRQNSQFLGFEFCIVVESSEDRRGLNLIWWIEVDCNIKSNHGYSREFSFSSFLHGRWVSKDAPISDHLLLFYDQIIYAKLFEGYEGYFAAHNSLVVEKASFQFRMGGPDGDYTDMIKRCGVHFLYEDKEQPMAITFIEGQPSRTLSIDEEEEDLPFKRFEVDDDQEGKEIMRNFTLWDFIVRFLHVCGLRNCCF